LDPVSILAEGQSTVAFREEFGLISYMIEYDGNSLKKEYAFLVD